MGTVHPPVHVPTIAEALPRLAWELFSRVTASTSPAHACGTLVTLTWVTLPLLSPFRVAVREDEVQPLTVALPAPSFPEVRPRLAAEAIPTDKSAAVSASPKLLVSSFMLI